MKREELRPTLWRTCRVLANEDRLRLFKAVIEHEGRYSVRQYARMFNLQDDVASVYLRQMNARGLLGVRRAEIKVFYNLDQNRSLPQAMELQRMLVEYLGGTLEEGWEDRLVRIFKGFTHPNRLAMISQLAKGGATLDELKTSAGCVVKSLAHHLRFLYGAGLIESQTRYHAPTLYRLLPQTHPVARLLLKQLLAEDPNGTRYYNPKEGTPDRESRAVLKKIRREEGVTMENWKTKRGTGVHHHKFSSKAQKAAKEGT